MGPAGPCRAALPRRRRGGSVPFALPPLAFSGKFGHTEQGRRAGNGRNPDRTADGRRQPDRRTGRGAFEGGGLRSADGLRPPGRVGAPWFGPAQLRRPEPVSETPGHPRDMLVQMVPYGSPASNPVTLEAPSAEMATGHYSMGWPVAFAIGAALVLGAADGYLAVIMESPGSSLAGSCLFVALVALAAGLMGWWRLKRRNKHLAQVFLISMIISGILATWWAWAFAMPASMAWDSSATPSALEALEGIAPDHSVCVKVTSGSIGPLDAPYERCAIVAPPGATVSYYAGSTANSPARGLIFFHGARLVGTDQFVRHLVGDWYAFTEDPSGMLGYSFMGGA